MSTFKTTNFTVNLVCRRGRSSFIKAARGSHVSAVSADDSFRAAQEIKKKLSGILDIEILGPVDSPIFKVKKKYRTRLLIRSQNSSLIQKKIAKLGLGLG